MSQRAARFFGWAIVLVALIGLVYIAIQLWFLH